MSVSTYFCQNNLVEELCILMRSEVLTVVSTRSIVLHLVVVKALDYTWLCMVWLLWSGTNLPPLKRNVIEFLLTTWHNVQRQYLLGTCYQLVRYGHVWQDITLLVFISNSLAHLLQYTYQKWKTAWMMFIQSDRIQNGCIGSFCYLTAISWPLPVSYIIVCLAKYPHVRQSSCR